MPLVSLFVVRGRRSRSGRPGGQRGRCRVPSVPRLREVHAAGQDACIRWALPIAGTLTRAGVGVAVVELEGEDLLEYRGPQDGALSCSDDDLLSEQGSGNRVGDRQCTGCVRHSPDYTGAQQAQAFRSVECGDGVCAPASARGRSRARRTSGGPWGLGGRPRRGLTCVRVARMSANSGSIRWSSGGPGLPRDIAACGPPVCDRLPAMAPPDLITVLRGDGVAALAGSTDRAWCRNYLVASIAGTGFSESAVPTGCADGSQASGDRYRVKVFGSTSNVNAPSALGSRVVAVVVMSPLHRADGSPAPQRSRVAGRDMAWTARPRCGVVGHGRCWCWRVRVGTRADRGLTAALGVQGLWCRDRDGWLLASRVSGISAMSWPVHSVDGGCMVMRW
jgi:hypothetical protein